MLYKNRHKIQIVLALLIILTPPYGTLFNHQDGLFLVTNSLDLVSGYPLAILTPNINEYKRLVRNVLNCEVNDQDAPGQLLYLAKR